MYDTMSEMSAEPTSSASEAVLDERASSPGILLALLGQEAMRRLRAAHAAVGVSPRQFHVLGLLHDRGPMSQSELGQILAVDKSIVVALLNPLELNGLVSRKRDSADRRRHVVSLTAAGKRQLDKATRAQHEVEAELFAGLSSGELRTLAASLLALRASLSAEDRSAPSEEC